MKIPLPDRESNPHPLALVISSLGQNAPAPSNPLNYWPPLVKLFAPLTGLKWMQCIQHSCYSSPARHCNIFTRAISTRVSRTLGVLHQRVSTRAIQSSSRRRAVQLFTAFPYSFRARIGRLTLGEQWPFLFVCLFFQQKENMYIIMTLIYFILLKA